MIPLFKTKPTGREVEAIKRVIDSGWWSQGKVVEQFEKAFAKSVGAKYAVATNSCTTALEVAVQCVKLPKTVTVSPFTFISSALAPMNAGHLVKFVDVDRDTYCTKKADIQVLYAGNDYGEGIIYDMAHFGGGKHKDPISCWSFHAVKNLPTGDGGMLTTNEKQIYDRAKALVWCGIDKTTYDRSKKGYSWDYNVVGWGMKGNMNDITAAIGLEQLKEVKKNNKRRAEIAKLYYKYLPDNIKVPYPSKTWHLFTIEVPNRDGCIAFLAKNGVQTGVHYKPLYNYSLFGKQPKLRNTEEVFSKILSLPMHLYLTDQDVRFICKLIKEWTEKQK